MNIYQRLGRVFPAGAVMAHAPRHILIVLPCCIGDVVMGTATLVVLRRAYPAAHITWLVSRWARPVLDHHPLLDHIIEVPPAVYQPRTPQAVYRLVRQVRAGGYDLVVSLSRSPLVGAAVGMSGVAYRAGLDSAGRGFGYNIRASLDPTERRHEAEIYLDVPRALGLEANMVYPRIPIPAQVSARLRQAHAIPQPYVMVNPSGGQNPGAQMDAKRYPPAALAALVNRVAPTLGIETVVIASGPGDEALVTPLAAQLNQANVMPFVGTLSLRSVGALATTARLYIGNDTGLTHLAAAAGAKTVMVMGPTDPARYRPYAPHALALWRPHDLPPEGVAAGGPSGWDWNRDGIHPAEAADAVLAFLEA